MRARATANTKHPGGPKLRLIVLRLSIVLVGLLLLSTIAALSPFRAPAAVATSLGYARAYGGSTSADSAFGFGVAVDTSGNAYLSGGFTGTVDFDPGAGTAQLTSMGSFDGYGATLSANGDFHAAPLPLNGAGADDGRGIAADAAGNSYITGRFNDTSTGNRDQGYVVKRDTDGNNVWTAFFGGAGTARGFRVAVDGAANVYAIGYFSGVIDFDPGGGTVNLNGAGDSDTFLVKLNSNGTFGWVKQFGGAGEETSTGIALDGAGNIYLSGTFSGTADFDPGPGTFNLTAAGAYDAFAVKLDPTGAFVWARHFGGTSSLSDGAQDIGVDAAGNVYLTGFFHETADFDPSPGGTFNLTSAGAQDVFVVKLNSSGALVWAKQLGGAGADAAQTIAVDAAGNVHVGGQFNSVADFDLSPGGTFNLTDAGSGDAFVVKLDTNGALVWAERFGGAGQDEVNDLVLDGAGSIFMTGFFTGTVDFDPSPGTANLTSNTGDPAQTGAFVVKLAQRAPPVNVLPPFPVNPTSWFTPLVFSSARGNRISVAASEDGSSPLRISLSVTSGTLTLATTAGLSFSVGDGSVDTSMTFTGTLSAINAALDGLTFTPPPNSLSVFKLQMTTQDRSGQTDTDSLTIARLTAACGPRPGVSVTSTVANGTLQVTIAVTETDAPTNNTIQSIQFGTFQNATVTLNGQQITSGQTFTAPANTTSLTLVVTRTTPGQPTTVPFTVTDQCGSWPSFVGGGAGAGF